MIYVLASCVKCCCFTSSRYLAFHVCDSALISVTGRKGMMKNTVVFLTVAICHPSKIFYNKWAMSGFYFYSKVPVGFSTSIWSILPPQNKNRFKYIQIDSNHPSSISGGQSILSKKVGNLIFSGLHWLIVYDEEPAEKALCVFESFILCFLHKPQITWIRWN